MTVTVTHSKTLIAPSTGVEDKVYGADYVSATSHTLSGLGTGVDTALGVNVGSAGAFITFNGAGGTPSSMTATNLSGTAASLTAGTVTTNANLTGVVTSVGNATAIANKAIALAKLADGTAGNVVTYDASGVIAVAATGTATHVLTSNGAGLAPTFQANPAAGATLNGVTAATGAVTIASGNNTGIVWNWANTTDSTIAFTYGETSAATNGTSTSGVPNQVLLKLITAAASTQSPLSVYSRAAHVFSVSPTAAQILATNGSNAAPTYGFTSSALKGMYADASNLYLAVPTGNGLLFTVNGAAVIYATSTQIQQPVGSAASPALTDNSSATSGLFWSSGVLGVSAGNRENLRFLSNPDILQVSQGRADAVSYALNFRKARGTVASPTVITTADDLATISGFGYVGATGTYVEGCRITFDSTGTIANTTSGLGGIMRLAVAKVGTVGPAEIMRLTAATTTGGGWATLNEADANPGTADLADGDEVAVYCKAGNICFAQNVAGTINFLYTPIDGSTATWTANTTGP